MPDDPTDTGGFDDWLDEEPGPDTDPYAALGDDADAAAADEPDDCRHAHVDVPAVHRERDVGRHDLGHDRIHDRLQPGGPGGPDGL